MPAPAVAQAALDGVQRGDLLIALTLRREPRPNTDAPRSWRR